MGLPLSVRVSRASQGQERRSRRCQDTCLRCSEKTPAWTRSSSEDWWPSVAFPVSSTHTCLPSLPGDPSPCFQDSAFHQPPFLPVLTVAPIPTSFWSPNSRHNCPPLKDPGAEARWTRVTRRCLFINHPDKHSLPCSAQATLHSKANLPVSNGIFPVPARLEKPALRRGWGS